MAADVQASVRARDRGVGFWREVTTAYELNVDELELLAETCRCLDMIDELAASVASDGATVSGSRGQTRLHPAVGELRQNRVLLGRLLGQLSLPHDEEGAVLPTGRSARARRAAESRWAGERARRGA